MSWKRHVSIVALALSFGGGIAAAQTAPVPLGKNGDVELTEPMAVGATVLQPGHYRFTHQIESGQHLLVVRQRTMHQSRTGHFATGEGTEVARVPCQVIELGGKTKNTELYTRTLPDGSRVISQIRIAGEGARHLIALQPME